MPVYHQGAIDVDPGSRTRGKRHSIYAVEAATREEAKRKIQKWREANRPGRSGDWSMAGVMTHEEFARWSGQETIKGVRRSRGLQLQRERLEREKDRREGGSGETRRERNLRKARQLAQINNSLRSAKGEDRKLLLKERDIISKSEGRDVRAKQQPTTKKEFQDFLFEKQRRAATKESESVLPTSPAREIVTGFRTTVSTGDQLTESRLDLTAKGKPVFFESKPVPTRFQKAQDLFASKTTKKIPSLDPAAVDRIDFGGSKFGQFIAGAEKGTRSFIRDKPVEAALFVGGGALFKGAGLIASSTKLGAKIFKFQTGLLGVSFLGIKGVQISRAETAEQKGIIFGEATGEILAFGTGARIPSGIRAAKVKFEASVIRQADIPFDLTIKTPSRILGVRGTIEKPFARTIIEKKAGVKVSKDTPRFNIEFVNIGPLTTGKRPTPTKEIFETVSPNVEIVTPQATISTPPPFKQFPKTEKIGDVLRIGVTPKIIEIETATIKTRIIAIPGLKPFFITRKFTKLGVPGERQRPLVRRDVDIDLGVGKQVLIQKLEPPKTKTSQKQKSLQRQNIFTIQQPRQRVSLLPKQRLFRRSTAEQRAEVKPKLASTQDLFVLSIPKIARKQRQRVELVPSLADLISQKPKALVRQGSKAKAKAKQKLDLGVTAIPLIDFPGPRATLITDPFGFRGTRKDFRRGEKDEIVDRGFGFDFSLPGRKEKGKKGKRSGVAEGPFDPLKVGSVLAAFRGIKESSLVPFPKLITGLEIRPIPTGRRK